MEFGWGYLCFFSYAQKVSCLLTHSLTHSLNKSLVVFTDGTDDRKPLRRKKRSRWSEDAGSGVGPALPVPGVANPVLGAPGLVNPQLGAPGLVTPQLGVGGLINTAVPPMQAMPARHVMPTIQDFARKMVGSDDISPEQLKQIREQQELNKMYELILAQKKAKEAALMADLPGMKVKPKYEYDSDEDVEGGTWEHKNRKLEMEATKEWAEQLTDVNRGKHFIGDFLPPQELEKFMETFKALKEGREPDYSEYKEFKLTCENIGYQMLQKLGWKEGEGLGNESQGITTPVGKGNTAVEGRGLGIERPAELGKDDDEFDAYRKRMMLAYRFRPNPLNNPRRPYY
ncbi:SURP and G-patch domain-containing protein 1-like [Haliotis rubra]|uniref:SURP and G-patch domain-containing protein 1-like n=1 Tax=Haliotis rubra TaxID=36100 RepID=UPI001EE5B77E|nr:SURP and G-patch domain-containing protein 1-like [Haliotis rubra]